MSRMGNRGVHVQGRQAGAECRDKGTMCLNVQKSDEGVIGSSQGDTENITSRRAKKKCSNRKNERARTEGSQRAPLLGRK